MKTLKTLISATLFADLLTAIVIVHFCVVDWLGGAPESCLPQKAPTSPDAAANLIEPAHEASPAVDEVPPAPDSNRMVHVPIDKTLAKVNDIEITLRDVIPIGDSEGGAAQVMSVEMYDSVLKQAIDRELIFQTAKARSLELTEDQKQQLKKIHESFIASRSDDVDRMDTLGTAEDQVGFELRSTESQLLLNSLLAQEVGEDTEKLQKFIGQLRADAKIKISKSQVKIPDIVRATR